MTEISTYRTSLSPIQLNIKHNNSALSNHNSFLQDTSSLEGTVTGIDKDAVILTTIQGKFSLSRTSDTPSINKGDRLVVNLSSESKNGKLLAQLLFINKTDIRNSQLLPIKVIELTHRPSPERSTASTVLENISLSSTATLPKIFNAKVNYLNLNNINQNSQMYLGLDLLRKGTSVEFAILSRPNNQLPLTNQIPAEIIDSNTPQSLIKTPFGILELKNKELPIGRKFYIILKTINGQELATTDDKLSGEDFLFKLSSILNKLKIATAGNSTSNQQYVNSKQSMPQYNSKAQNINELEDAIYNSQSKQEIIKLIALNSELDPLMQIIGAKNMGELISKINNNQITFQQLSSILKSQKYKDLITKKNNNNLTHKSKQYSSFSIKNHLDLEQNAEVNDIVDHVINSSAQNKIIKDLSEDFIQIKELLSQNISATDNELWYWLNVPILTDEEVIKHKIFINKQHNQQIRFVVDLSTETLGDIQLEGLIRLNIQDRKPEAFDLTLRLKNRLNQAIQAQIAELYQLGLNISNIEGMINFNVTENLSKFDNDNNHN